MSGPPSSFPQGHMRLNFVELECFIIYMTVTSKDSIKFSQVESECWNPAQRDVNYKDVMMDPGLAN